MKKYKATNKTLKEEIEYSFKHVKVNNRHTNKLGLMIEDLVCKAMVGNGNDPAFYQDLKMECIYHCFYAVNRMKIKEGKFYVYDSRINEDRPIANVFNYIYTVAVMSVRNERKKEIKYDTFINELAEIARQIKEEDIFTYETN
jgi:hypothetical protein